MKAAKLTNFILTPEKEEAARKN